MTELDQSALQAKQEHYLSLVYTVFKTNSQGVELLALLKESLLEKIAVADPDKSESHAFFREGQNSIIRSFAANIAAYEQVISANAKKTTEANEASA